MLAQNVQLPIPEPVQSTINACQSASQLIELQPLAYQMVLFNETFESDNFNFQTSINQFISSETSHFISRAGHVTAGDITNQSGKYFSIANPGNQSVDLSFSANVPAAVEELMVSSSMSTLVHTNWTAQTVVKASLSINGGTFQDYYTIKDYSGIPHLKDELTNNTTLVPLSTDFMDFSFPISKTALDQSENSIEFKISFINFVEDVFLGLDNVRITARKEIDQYAFYKGHPKLGFSPDHIGATYDPNLTNSDIIYITSIDEAGNESKAAQVKVINGTGLAVSCEDQINLSLAPDCGYELKPEFFVPYDQAHAFRVELRDESGNIVDDNLIGRSEIGQLLQYRVIEICNGNSCWGNILVEAKLLPELHSPCEYIDGSPIFCESWCGQEDVPEEGFIRLDEVRDALEDFCFTEVIELSEQVEDIGGLCTADGLVKKITYFAIVETHDGPEKVVLITQIFRVVPPDIDQVILPNPVTLECGSGTEPLDIYHTLLGNEDDAVSQNYANIHAYPYLQSNKTIVVQDYQAIDTVHYLAPIDTVESMVLHNEQWILLPVVIKELRDSIVYDTFDVDIPQVVSLREGDSFCHFIVTKTDAEVASCSGTKKILRSWTITDWCNLEVRQLPVQVIEVRDQLPPVVEAIDDVVIAVDPWSCVARYDFPIVFAEDFCSEDIKISWKTKGAIISGNALEGLSIDDSPIELTAIVSDGCDNQVRTNFTITIIDQSPPVPICQDEISISLSEEGANILNTSHFDIGSFDAGCGGVWFKILRADVLNESFHGFWNDDGVGGSGEFTLPPDPIFFPPFPCNSADGDDYTTDFYFEQGTNLFAGFALSGDQFFFDDEVSFCCEDIQDDNLMVVLRVFDVDPGPGAIDPRRMISTNAGPVRIRNDKGNLIETTNQVNNDLNGRFRDCWVKVNVVNKAVPDLVCQDTTIQCLDDLSIVPTPYSVGSLCDGQSVRLQLELDNSESCSNRQIVRTWFIDLNGDEMMDVGEPFCNQTIDIVAGESGFDPQTIKWPKHFDGTIKIGNNKECNEGQLEITTGVQIRMGSAFVCNVGLNTHQPSYCDPPCGLVGMSVKVDTLFASDVCAKIVKEWTIVDWCEWEANGEHIDEDESAEDGFVAVEDWAQGVCETCENGEIGTDSVYFEYDSFQKDGYYSYKQIIKIEDRTLPSIFAPDTLYIEVGLNGTKDDPGSCLGSQIVRAEGRDFCNGAEVQDANLKWNVSIRNQSGQLIESNIGNVIEEGTGTSFEIDSRAGTAGDTYFIDWRVSDLCRNEAQSRTVLQFIDRKEPIIFCLSGVSSSFNERDSALVFWAKDLDIGTYDHCTLTEDLLFSVIEQGTAVLHPGDPDFGSQSSITFPCTNQDEVKFLELWVWDQFGNSSFCPSTLRIDGDCMVPTDTMGTDTTAVESSYAFISGSIYTEQGEMIEGAEMAIYSSLPDYPSSMQTGNDGQYMFQNNPKGNSYELAALKDYDFLNGVSTSDLLLIQYHLSGLREFTSPYQYFAADVTNDKRISSIDLINLRNLILGKTSRFPNNLSWRFVDATQQFSNINNPWPFKEILKIEDLAEDMRQENFIGVKIGDVNGSTIPNLHSALLKSTTKRKKHVLLTDNLSLKKGEEAIINFTIDKTTNPLGMQGTFNYTDLTLLPHKNITDDEIFTNKNRLSFSWTNESGSRSLFSLKVVALDDIPNLRDVLSLTDDQTVSEVYLENESEVHDIELQFRSKEIDFQFIQVAPNPFSQSTQVQYYVSKDEGLTYQIHSIDGRLVLQDVIKSSSGLNTFNLDGANLPSRGLYILSMHTNGKTIKEKILLIK